MDSSCPLSNSKKLLESFPRDIFSFQDISKGRCEGSFTFYVDKILKFFDPSLPLCRHCLLSRQFIYWSIFTCVDIWRPPPSLLSVYLHSEWPHIDDPFVEEEEKIVCTLYFKLFDKLALSSGDFLWCHNTTLQRKTYNQDRSKILFLLSRKPKSESFGIVLQVLAIIGLRNKIHTSNL